MRAAVCAEHGPPEVVTVGALPSPPLGAGEVRVRVAAAAVNFPDVLVVADRYQISVAPPFVPGSEFAGLVAETGADVDTPVVGDAVMGSALVGAFAEEIVVPAPSLTVVPADVDLRRAAGFGVAHRTAFHTLRSVARLAPGEQLVVLGAGGGVGLAAVELGALAGATVTAVASSPEKLAVAGSRGAAHLVDRTRGELRESLRSVLTDGADVVVDPVGGAASEPALRSLRRGGRFVTVGYASGEIPRIPLNLVLLKGVTVAGFELGSFARHEPQALAAGDRELLEHLAAGRVAPHVGASFPLAEVSAALRHVADGRAVGKVLVEIGG